MTAITYTARRDQRPDILGPELAPSMTASNWTAGNSAALSNNANGYLKVAYNAVNYPLASRLITVVAGTIYRIQISCPNDGASFAPRINVGVAQNNALYDFFNHDKLTSQQTIYIRAPATTLYVTLICDASSANYALFAGLSVKSVATFTHAAANVMQDDLFGGLAPYSAGANTTFTFLGIWASPNRYDHAVQLTNVGANYGQLNRQYPIPTIAGRTYKASTLWVPHSCTFGRVYGNADPPYSQLDYSLNGAASFFTYSTGLLWDFTNTADGWTLTNVTSVLGATFISLTSTTTSPSIQRAGLSFSGLSNRYVAVRVKRTSVAWSDNRNLFYTTAGHGFSASYYATNLQLALVQGEYTILVYDMWQLAVGGDDWKNATITGLKLDFTSTSAATWDVDYIAVGNLNELAHTFTSLSDGSAIQMLNSNESNATGYYILPHCDQLADSGYTLDNYPSRLAPTPAVQGGRNISLDGRGEWGYVHRVDNVWSLTTDRIYDNEYDDWYEFLSSVSASEVFIIDLKGTVAAPFDQRNAVLANSNWKAERIAAGPYWRFSFDVRLLPQ